MARRKKISAKYTTIDSELDIYYQESGYGDIPILLVPGWTMTTRAFEHQLDFFSTSEDYRFITYDPRAHGQSSKTISGHFYEQHGRDLHQFIENLELDNVILGGWSFGTLATLSYLNQFEHNHLRGFIMLDGPPRATGKDNKTDWATYRYDDADHFQKFFTLERLTDSKKTNHEFAQWMLEDRSEKNIEVILSMTIQTPDTSAALLNATANFLDYREDLISLETALPLIYIVREQQKEVVSQWAKNHTPSAQVTAFGEHMMFWERPQEFNRVLVEYADMCRRNFTP